jgi:hypothetical protein
MAEIEYEVRIRTIRSATHTMKVEVPDIMEGDPQLIDKVMHQRAKQKLITRADLPGEGTDVSTKTEVIHIYRDAQRVYPRVRIDKKKTP